jgi:hypothetical protein
MASQADQIIQFLRNIYQMQILKHHSTFVPNKGATSSQRQRKLSYKYARPMLPGKVAKSTQNISKASKPLMSSSKNGSSLHNSIQNGGKKFQEP